MIPTSFFIALMVTLLVVINFFMENNNIFIKNKALRMLYNFVLYSLCGALWFYAIYHNSFENNDILIFMTFFNGIMVGVILMCVLWKEDTPTFIDTNKPNEIIYTLESLIGMTGTIQYYYNEGKYLGCLDDKAKSGIIVKIDGDVPYNSKFKITKIDACDIIAELI